MKTAVILVLSWMLAAGTGCTLTGKPKPAPTPAAPKPVAPKPAPAPPPEPLSAPQNQVELPAPQPLSPEALATTQEPPAVEQQTTPRPPPRRAPMPAPRRAETEPAPPPPAPQTTEPQTPRLQPLVPADEQRRIAENIDSRKRETRERLDAVARQRLSPSQRNMVDRIRSFLALSDEAAARGDMRQADSLSERALVLARELKIGR